MDPLVVEISKEAREKVELIEKVRAEVSKVIVGQNHLIDSLLIAMLCNGHILVEGVPGLAKTLAIKTLANALNLVFHRIQFTPDLMPADITGTRVYHQRTGEFTVQKGPIFANFILADEINRAPPKVQSALLEAMQELQVTIGDETFKLNQPFLVMATQNPIEQEGTYPLPEAQVDRFMLKTIITYPTKEEEKTIIDRMAVETPPSSSPVLDSKQIIEMSKTVHKIYIDPKVKNYIVDIVAATRNPKEVHLQNLEGLIEYGASPRASLYLTLTSKAKALIDGRGYVTPADVKYMAHSVLRHRIIRTFEAEAENVTSDNIIDQILEAVEVP